jgi:hypothetical protein
MKARRHQEKSIDKYVTTLNSPEVQAQLRKIKGSEADSMAVELMRHTAFALTGATSKLALLDSVDEDRWDAEGYLQRVFNSSDYPFRKKWIALEEGLLGGHAHLKSEGQSGLADSLKTHPDRGLRIKLIGPLVTGGDASLVAGGGTTGMGNTKIVITNLVMMEFNPRYKVATATIFDKAKNTALASSAADYGSQRALALYLKMMGAFDYAFTTGDADNSNFAVCYIDYERSSEYHGHTFNAIRYNGKKFTTDKVELKSKASMMRIFPAKAGSIMIMEYFRKDKRLDFRLEKLG